MTLDVLYKNIYIIPGVLYKNIYMTPGVYIKISI